MKHWFGMMFCWLSTASRPDGSAETKVTRISNYERHLRRLDERAGRLFLP
jgi:hypothetical protein